MLTATTAAHKLYVGDVLTVLETLPAGHFDAVLSDPPYGLSFMGKQWDHSVPSKLVYEALNRTLKPGAMGLHFGGTRTFHRLAVNLEDAGFELRDCLSWLYGSGFPKSHNVSKALDKQAGAERAVVGEAITGNARTAAGWAGGQCTVPLTTPATPAAVLWDGYGTALKPAWEPCLLVQKPLAGTFANNVLTHGCGALNIDGSRIGRVEGDRTEYGRGHELPHANTTESLGKFAVVTAYTPAEGGRFPANLLLDEEAAAALDATQPKSKSAKSKGTGKALDTQGQGWGFKSMPGGFEDSGGPSRFFYCAKVSTAERNAGCEALDAQWMPGAEFRPNHMEKAEQGESGNPFGRWQPKKNNHPTLKPIALTTYLAGLLLPPPREDGQPRRILVPFSGSGSEVIGCLLAGWDEVVGIELDPAYVEIAEARIAHHCKAK